MSTDPEMANSTANLPRSPTPEERVSHTFPRYDQNFFFDESDRALAAHRASLPKSPTLEDGDFLEFPWTGQVITNELEDREAADFTSNLPEFTPHFPMWGVDGTIRHNTALQGPLPQTNASGSAASCTFSLLKDRPDVLASLQVNADRHGMNQRRDTAGTTSRKVHARQDASEMNPPTHNEGISVFQSPIMPPSRRPRRAATTKTPGQILAEAEAMMAVRYLREPVSAHEEEVADWNRAVNPQDPLLSNPGSMGMRTEPPSTRHFTDQQRVNAMMWGASGVNNCDANAQTRWNLVEEPLMLSMNEAEARTEAEKEFPFQPFRNGIHYGEDGDQARPGILRKTNQNRRRVEEADVRIPSNSLQGAAPEDPILVGEDNDQAVAGPFQTATRKRIRVEGANSQPSQSYPQEGPRQRLSAEVAAVTALRLQQSIQTSPVALTPRQEYISEKIDEVKRRMRAEGANYRPLQPPFREDIRDQLGAEMANSRPLQPPSREVIRNHIIAEMYNVRTLRHTIRNSSTLALTQRLEFISREIEACKGLKRAEEANAHPHNRLLPENQLFGRNYG